MPSPPLSSPARDDSRAEIAVVFAGGGTGGHLFPNLAVAREVEAACGAPAGGAARGAPVRTLFLCSKRPIDAAILSREGVAFTPVPAAAPSLRPLALLRFLRGWGPSVRAGREAIRAARKRGGRVVLVASGGFVAAPVVQAARVEKCPVVMLNLDAVAGRANRWIAGHATRIFTTANSGPPAWERIPPIVRAEALPSARPPRAVVRSISRPTARRCS